VYIENSPQLFFSSWVAIVNTDMNLERDRSAAKTSVLNGRLFKTQLYMLRGLQTRLKKLRYSRSADREVLDANREVANAHFLEQQRQTSSIHTQYWRSAMTDWDIAIDKQIALAERETLQSITEEKQKTKKLKLDFIQTKASQKKWQEESAQENKKKRDDSKAAAAKSRDNIKSKLDNESLAIEQLLHECREWVGLRTSNVAMQNMTALNTAEHTTTAGAISDLSTIGKQFESVKKAIEVDIKRLQSHPVSRLSGSYWFLAICPLLGLIAASIAWTLNVAPLLVAMTGIVGSILFALLLHFITAPLVYRTVKRLFPTVVEREQLAYSILQQGKRIADSNCNQECVRQDQAFTTNQQKLDEQYREMRAKAQQDFDEQTQTIATSHREKRQAIATRRRSRYESTNVEQTPLMDTLVKDQSNELLRLQQSHQATLAGLEDSFLRSQKYTVQRWMSGCVGSANRMRAIQDMTEKAFPDWNATEFTTGEWPRVVDSLAWKLGEIDPGLTLRDAIKDLDLTSELPSQAWPVFYDLLSHGALVLETHPDCKETSNDMVRNTLLRAVTSVPAGNLNVTIIDPEGLGKQFSWLMSLADVDPALVNHRVWTQPLHISEQLANTARHVEDVIQQSLRNHHANLIEYNQQAGPMAVPYRLIVWSNFPFGLDDHSWQSLCSILSSGGKCGVGVILQLSNTHVWPTFADRSKIDEFGLRCSLRPVTIPGTATESARTETVVTIDHPELAAYPLKPMLPPDEERLKEIMSHQLEAASAVGKCVVPFESISLPKADQQSASSADALAIPLGISDAGRVQMLKLGTGTAQHVLIAGKTGSGKSSLLHTLITSAAMKYSPQELRMVLLDFKKGVEFQVYSQVALSHADIIGIESKREFGVSTLEYIDRLLHARGEAFRQWGVQDLSSLSKKYPEHALPRILILIDEFQELFVEDDKLSQQASMLMDRIVRQGRSFGVHLILASQTLGGAYSLPRTTLSQMAVRIALQCDSSDAMLILSEDNTAAERLRHSGQAIYNETGGRIESNQGFQVAYIEKNDQVERLGQLSHWPVPHSPTTNALGRQIVFEGHKPAVWDESSIALAVSGMRMDAGSVPMILGDSVSIDPPVCKPLSRSAGRNVMVVGQDESSAASLLAGTIAGLGFASTMPAGSETASAMILDGSRTEDESMRGLLSQLPQSRIPVTISDVREIESTVEKLHQEFERRNANPNQHYPTMLIAIVNIARFRELRRSEEFSFGDDSGGGVKPDAVLANILRDGPSVGMHVWIWADSAGTLSRWVSRQSMRDIELRILMQMSATDSNQLIDSNAANRLDRYVALIHDDIEGKAVKFRPFSLDSVLQKLT
jgi:hypothetical protein